MRENCLKGEKESHYWQTITHQYMSLESSDDDGEGNTLYQVHSPVWRSQGTCVYLLKQSLKKFKL